MPHALLLSPDDQAVTAITGVLEEMSVTCERPLDGASAAQKLNSQSFDLVVVDCENLPAAKLIFDVCRRGKNGNNPVPIAIVDGRAGLPTAFRLGAELILTKPVAKDQARNTVRNAVSRVRKDVSVSESASAHAAAAATVSDASTTSTNTTDATISGAVVTEEHSLAAAAAATSSQLTSFAEPAPSSAPASVPTIASARLAAPGYLPRMHSAVHAAEDEIGVSPASPNLTPQSASASPSLSGASPDPAGSAISETKPPLKPSDDPVLAELERTELEESQPAESKLTAPKHEIAEPAKTATAQLSTKAETLAISSRPHGRKKTRGPLVASLVLALAGGGFYVAWTYQPGFRAVTQPQIDRLLTLVGMALPPASTPSPAKPSAHVATPSPAMPASGSPAAPPTHQATHQDSVSGSATSSATLSPAAAAPAQPSATPTTVIALQPSNNKNPSAPNVQKTALDPSSNTEKDIAATPSETPLPGENSAIILSSKGAEKRLAESVPPKYPVEARSQGAEGTVVLKEVVDENGKVESVRLVEGNAILATAAIKAVKQWRYRPYVRDGKAQPFQTVVIIDFPQP